MLGGRKILAVGALLAGLLLPAQAMAAYEAWTRADLNLRVGPGVAYGVIDVIPYGEPVVVIGCLDGIEWCDVEWYGLRGWVWAYYLAQPGTSVYLPQIYTRIGLPIIVFSFDSYHDRHYRYHPWYKKRYGRWRGKDWRRDRDDDDDRDRDRDYSEQDGDGADAPKKGVRTQKPGQTQKVERPRQLQETKEPKPQRTEQTRKRQEVQKPKQLQQTKQPQRQRTEQSRKRQEVQKPKQRQVSEQSSERPQKGESSQQSKKREPERNRGQ